MCRWEMCAQPKVVVKIESEEDMLVLQVKQAGLLFLIIVLKCFKAFLLSSIEIMHSYLCIYGSCYEIDGYNCFIFVFSHFESKLNIFL